MKVAAYQAPLDACGSAGIVALIREQVERYESEGVAFLCCPEGVLGGLADYVARPADMAIDARGGALDRVLAPLASNAVTTIVGFTEIDRREDRLYNSATVFHRGSVVGVYRKLHPAINQSVYTAGRETPVFTIGTLMFGILICRDSTFAEPVRLMAARGASVLFVPTNNGLPPAKGGAELIDAARSGDVAIARAHGVLVVRADVAGRAGELIAHGSSGIVGRDGTVLGSARRLGADLVVGELWPSASIDI